MNLHYVFNFKEDGQGFSVYTIAGIGMQNNFYGKKSVETNGQEVEMDRSNSTKFAFNLGGGITLPISERDVYKRQHRANSNRVTGVFCLIHSNYQISTLSCVFLLP